MTKFTAYTLLKTAGEQTKNRYARHRATELKLVGCLRANCKLRCAGIPRRAANCAALRCGPNCKLRKNRLSARKRNCANCGAVQWRAANCGVQTEDKSQYQKFATKKLSDAAKNEYDHCRCDANVGLTGSMQKKSMDLEQDPWTLGGRSGRESQTQTNIANQALLSAVLSS